MVIKTKEAVAIGIIIIQGPILGLLKDSEITMYKHEDYVNMNFNSRVPIYTEYVGASSFSIAPSGVTIREL